MKKKIKELEWEWSRDCITEESTLKDVLGCVNRLIQEYGEDAKIEFNSGYENISETIGKYVERDETDAEYKARVKREERKLKREREEYERLKKKFEGGNE